MTPDRPFTTRHVFALMALTLAVFMALEFALPVSLGKGKALCLEAGIALPLLGLWLLRRDAVRPFLRWNRTHPLALVGGALAGLGLAPVFDEVNRLFEMLVPMNPAIREALEESLRVQGANEWVLVLAAAVVVAALAEETLFRGFVQSVLESYGDVNKAVLVTALLFAMLHFNPWWFVELLVVGVLLGVMAVQTGSVFPAALAHGVYNAAAVLLLNLGPWPGYEWRNHVAPHWVLLGVVLAVAGFWLMARANTPVDEEFV